MTMASKEAILELLDLVFLNLKFVLYIYYMILF